MKKLECLFFVVVFQSSNLLHYYAVIHRTYCTADERRFQATHSVPIISFQKEVFLCNFMWRQEQAFEIPLTDCDLLPGSVYVVIYLLLLK